MSLKEKWMPREKEGKKEENRRGREKIEYWKWKDGKK